MAWLASAALLLALQGATGRPVVSVEVQPATVAVGEPFTVRLRVRASAGAAIRFPAVPDSGAGLEAVDPRAIEDRSSAAAFDQTAIYRFIAWEPGRHTVPLGVVTWDHPRGSETLAMSPVPIEVATMLPADTALQVPREARAPLDLPPAWWRWALGALGVLAIALMLHRAWRRRAATPRVTDAFVDAEASFAAVDALSLDDAGEPGRAVLAYAEVMRAYLTRRFPAATDGLTTPEFVTALAEHALPILPGEVAAVLETADAVKFARAAVDAEGVRRLARAARSVVTDVQTAYEARLAAAERGKGPRGRRRPA